LKETPKRQKIKSYRKDLLYLQAKIVETPINLTTRMDPIFNEIEIKNFVFFKKHQKLVISFLREILKIYLKIFVKHMLILWIRYLIKAQKNGVWPCEISRRFREKTRISTTIS
jgi:hypothetical protein